MINKLNKDQALSCHTQESGALLHFRLPAITS